jgi:hypothetical protein
MGRADTNLERVDRRAKYLWCLYKALQEAGHEVAQDYKQGWGWRINVDGWLIFCDPDDIRNLDGSWHYVDKIGKPITAAIGWKDDPEPAVKAVQDWLAKQNADPQP